MTPCITNISLSDGFGSQYQHIICCLLIAYRNGYDFAYNHIQKMHHNYDNDPDFLEKVENLMNIRPYFKSRYDESLINAGVTECDMTAKYVIDKSIDEYATDEHLGRIKEMFWANKDRKSVFTNGKVNVAVHIRRMNTHDKTLPFVEPERVTTGNDFYLNAMDRIRREHADKDLQFHIYSQGNIENFELFMREDTVLHLDEDLSKTFIEMVTADILVTTFSSFSYIAGYLNDGIVYYQSFWHPKRGKWIHL